MLPAFASEFSIAVALVSGLLLLVEAGYRLGRRAVREREALSGGQLGAIQGAILGLLGLLLGFAFAGAASRFIERQDLITQEANAIGTAYLRADLLDEANATRLRESLAAYVRHRIEYSQSIRSGISPEAAAQIAALHAQIWEAARNGVMGKPEAMRVVLDPVNSVIDFHATRIAAGKKHLPVLVLGLLVSCSLLAMAVIGYGCGIAGRRSMPMTSSLVFLVAAALWTTIDFDHPRSGIVRLSDAPLKQLNLSLRSAP